MSAQNSDARPEASRPGVLASVPPRCQGRPSIKCVPGDRCPNHHIDVDPPSIGDLLGGVTEKANREPVNLVEKYAGWDWTYCPWCGRESCRCPSLEERPYGHGPDEPGFIP